jgi:hypothetical protein
MARNYGFWRKTPTGSTADDYGVMLHAALSKGLSHEMDLAFDDLYG